MSFTTPIEQVVEENFNGLLSCPPTWPRVPLGELTDIKNGIPLPSSGFAEGGRDGHPVVRIRNVLPGSTDTRFVGSVEDDWFIDAGDLLVGMDGDFNAARWPGPRALLNQRVCRIQPKDHRVSVQYLMYVLPGYLEAVNKHTPSITVKHLSSRTIAALPIPVPPSKQQAHLVARLDSLLSCLEHATTDLDQAVRRLAQARSATLKAAVEGRLVPTEADLARAEGRDYEHASVLLARIIEERRARHEAEQAGAKRKKKYQEPVAPEVEGLPELPEGWVWARTDQLLCFVTTGSRGWAKYYDPDGVPFIRIGDLERGTLHVDVERAVRVRPPETPERERARVEGSDLLVSVTADLGIVGLLAEGIGEAYVNQHVAIARPVNSGYAKFLAWALASDSSGQHQFRSLRRGATKAGLGLDDLRAIAVPLPPLPEQHRIVAELDRRLSILSALEATIDTNLARCARLRQAILKAAFEGRLVSSDDVSGETSEPDSGAVHAGAGAAGEGGR